MKGKNAMEIFENIGLFFHDIAQYIVYALDLIWCTTIWVINLRYFKKRLHNDPEARTALDKGLVLVLNIQLLRQIIQIGIVGDTRWFHWAILAVILVARMKVIAKIDQRDQW